jgi:uncharacterized membrane protein YebE (DUF533 family)
MDAERLLGSLITGSLSRGTRGINKGALAIGAIGIAMAAWEHYQQQQRASAAGQGFPPPPPPPGTGPAMPSPPPGAGPAIPPPPPAAAPGGAAEREAMLLIRAMVAAAHADGQLDAEERARILDRVRAAGLGAEEQARLGTTLVAPPTIDELVGGVTSPDLAEQVYIVSLLAIRPDTEAERGHLAALARALALDGTAVARLHRLVGVPAP